MFHCDSPDSVKSRCLDSLTSHEIQSPRVVIATSAIGCGINVKGLKYVCHFGLAHSLVDYCQQIGRAGRDNESDCHAILYSYAASKKVVNIKMKDYTVLDGQCLRTKLFSPFSETNHVPSLTVGHNCCSFCTTSCDCGIDHQPLFDFEKENDFCEDTPKVAIRDVSTGDKEAISSMIFKYHHDRCTENLHLPSSSVTGLTESIVNDIVNQLEFIDSPAYLMNNVSILEFNLAESIFQLISNFFSSKDKCETESELSDIDMIPILCSAITFKVQ
ncbi:ATP-dependent DNA helicase Q1-like [Clytia hemisphaerica]|uniref:ATP-dependent DNA helicase Q1-like n=1 Tax=Clytia hemisphaerica TaxID=252671 RepID=UPI0034D65886